MTILDAFSAFRSEALIANDYSQAYVDNFWWMIRSLTDFCGNIQTEDLTLDLYVEWRMHISDKHRPNTVHTYVSQFRKFVDWMADAGICPSLPIKKVKAPKRPKPNPVYLTASEINRMVAAAQNVRDKAIIDVLFSCGIRNTECRELRRSDVSGTDVHVQHGAKGRDNRYVFLSARARRHLDVYLQSRTDRSVYLFVTRSGQKLARSTLRYIIASIGQRAGVDPSKCHPHAARHGNGTYLMEMGMHMRAIQELMGHKYITTTQLYTHPERSSLRLAHKAIFDGRSTKSPHSLRRQIEELQHKLEMQQLGEDGATTYTQDIPSPV